jgi:hypothetical protein
VTKAQLKPTISAPQHQKNPNTHTSHELVQVGRTVFAAFPAEREKLLISEEVDVVGRVDSLGDAINFVGDWGYGDQWRRPWGVRNT